MKPRHAILLGATAIVGLYLAFGRRVPESARIVPPAWAADPELRDALEQAVRERNTPDSERHELVGTVTGVDGEPRADVLVGVRGPATFEFTWTDPAGSFRLANLETGTLDVACVSSELPHLRTTVELPRNGPLELTLPAPLGPVPTMPAIERAPLEGLVETSFSEPPEGYEVAFLPLPREATPGETPTWAAGLEGRVPRRVRCDSGGAFGLPDLALGPYRVMLLPPWAAGGTWPVLLERSFDHGAEVRELVLRSQAGRISGALSDDRGAPIVGARVEVTDAESPDRVWPPELTGPDGGFLVRHLPEGTYRVAVVTGEARVEERVRVSALRASEVAFEDLRLLAGD